MGRRNSGGLSVKQRGSSYVALWVLIAGLSVCSSVRLLAGQPTSAEIRANIEGPQTPNRGGHDPLTLEQMMHEYGVPGVSLAVINDFGIEWEHAYGIADVATGARVDGDTLFQAASISKPVAAMAVLKAVELGKFSLDQDINTILESWSIAPSEHTKGSLMVTPRSLLSHTSGLGDGFGFPGYHPSDPTPTTVQILDGDEPSNVGAVRMERAPMTGYKYSGGGVTVMQLALTDTFDQPFSQILQDLVLGPIGMTRSAYEQPLGAERDRNAARAHDQEGRARDAKWHVYPELQAAGLWTTPTDLAKFAIEVQLTLRDQSNRVLPRSLVQEMVNPVGVGDFGVGFSISKRGQGWYFAHGGSNWGFRCDLIAHKVKGYGLVIMTNGDNGSIIIGELRDRVARAYQWDSLDKPIPR